MSSCRPSRRRRCCAEPSDAMNVRDIHAVWDMRARIRTRSALGRAAEQQAFWLGRTAGASATIARRASARSHNPSRRWRCGSPAHARPGVHRHSRRPAVGVPICRGVSGTAQPKQKLPCLPRIVRRAERHIGLSLMRVLGVAVVNRRAQRLLEDVPRHLADLPNGAAVRAKPRFPASAALSQPSPACRPAELLEAAAPPLPARPQCTAACAAQRLSRLMLPRSCQCEQARGRRLCGDRDRPQASCVVVCCMRLVSCTAAWGSCVGRCLSRRHALHCGNGRAGARRVALCAEQHDVLGSARLRRALRL